MEEYRGKHEKQLKDWQERRSFGKHEHWEPAEDAQGYIRVIAPVQRTYGPQKMLHVSDNQTGSRRRIVTARQIFSFQDPGMVHRAIPAEGIVKPCGPIWNKAPQANYWLGTRKQGLLQRIFGQK